jgi:hypothetical protein
VIELQQNGRRNIDRVTAELSILMELLSQCTDMSLGFLCTVARRDEMY